MKRTEELEKLRDLSDAELAQALDRAREDLFRSKIGVYSEQVENTASIREKRRKIARILTIVKRRESKLEVQAQGTSAAKGKDS